MAYTYIYTPTGTTVVSPTEIDNPLYRPAPVRVKPKAKAAKAKAAKAKAAEGTETGE